MGKKRIAIVTGASEGLGFALTNELLMSGYDVVGISSNKIKMIKS